jgi:hypothetical protein
MRSLEKMNGATRTVLIGKDCLSTVARKNRSAVVYASPERKEHLLKAEEFRCSSDSQR